MNTTIDQSVISQIEEWETFYKDVFGLEKAIILSQNSNMPKLDIEFKKLVVIPAGLLVEDVYMVCDRYFDCIARRGFDGIKDFRNTKKDYAIAIRGQVEADLAFGNFSGDELEKRQICGITLLERLAFGLFYFWKTNQHLDLQTITLCTGSRFPDGRVPSVDFESDIEEVEIGSISPVFSEEYYCTREVIKA